MTTAPERDINELFDDIVLTEERLQQQSYEEGYQEGRAQGNHEGYQLGYAQGVQLGEELGKIYGIVVAQQQLPHTERLQRTLEELRAAIEEFPRENDPEQDIIGSVENIRKLYRKLQAMLGSRRTNQERTTESEAKERKDFTF